jgi:CRP/FNR family transcriptional regulator, cyclic AMP receptor protein
METLVRSAREREATALRNVPLFSTLSPELVDLLANVAVTKHYPKNTFVLSAGDKADFLYVILSGSVKISVVDIDGKEVILTFLEAGDIFGEMALIDDHPRSADIVTRESCELIIINKAGFRQCLASSSALSMQIMLDLVHKLREADKKIESLALVNVYGRVAQVLLESSEKEGDTLVVKRKLTRQDIGRLVGASREMVTRVMRDLADGHYINIDSKKILLYPKLEMYTKEIGRAYAYNTSRIGAS